MARRNHPIATEALGQAQGTATRLAYLRRRARLTLRIESLTVASLIPLGIIAAFLILTLLGAGGWQTDLIAGAALIAALYTARNRHHPPSATAIDRRIEQDSQLAHRPIAGFEDQPALIPPQGAALWQAHRTRLDRTIATAKVGLPHPDFATHDPYALRILLLLALIAAWIAAGNQAGNRLADSLHIPNPFAGPGITLQTWITPPHWTGQPPRLITPGPNPIHTLTGTTLSLIATGATGGPPDAQIGPATLPFTTIATGSYRATETLTTPTTITIGPFWHRIATYHLIVAPPIPPTIAFTTNPTPDPDRKRLDLAWTTLSPYPITRITLQFHPAGAKPESTTLPTRHASSASARLNLLASPYAGLAVTGTLQATNKGAQTGHSNPAHFNLPAPILHNKTAQALESLRRALALYPQTRPALIQSLKTIATHPPAPITPGTQHAIARFAAAFAANNSKASHPETTLWTLVERAELGIAFRTAQQLAAARHALTQALQHALAGKSLTNTKLQKLLAQLAARAQANRSAQNPNTQAQPMTLSAIDRLAEKIARESAAGQTADQTARAQRDLAKLKSLLRQLQAAKPISPAQQAQQKAAGQAARALSKLMRQEAHLMNRTARQNPNTPPPLGNMAGQQPSQRSEALAHQQQSLQHRLQSTAQAMARAGLHAGPHLSQGAQAMQGAKAQLQMGNRPGAVPAERAAIAALQQAQGQMQSMQAGHGTGGGPSGLGQHASGGRGQFGNQSHGIIALGHAGAHSTARTIQNRLIHRDAKPNLPPPAHAYYHRLLGHDL